jgi:protein TonB
VVVQVNVSVEGLPLSVSVAQSSGVMVLDDAALAWVRQWHFVPASRGGTPVPGTAEIPVRYRLTD